MTPAPTGVDSEDAARHAADGAARRADERGLVGLVERGEALGLDRVEVGAHVGEERRELGRADRADRQRLELQQLRVRRVLPREDQVAERDGQARRAVEPAVAHDLEEVLRRRRVGDGHAQLDDVLGVRAVQAHAERLVVQDSLAVDVLDDHVEDLGVVVDLGLELEVGRDDDLDVEQAARHGADVRGALDALDAGRIIRWVYSLQVLPPPDAAGEVPPVRCAGFRGSGYLGAPFEVEGSRSSSYYDVCHIAMTYTALAILTILGDDLSRVDRAATLRHVRQLQQPDGSFCAFDGGERHMRFLLLRLTSYLSPLTSYLLPLTSYLR